MERGQVAFELMALYGKLRRATDEQARAAIKEQIDGMVGRLRVPDFPPSQDARIGLEAGD